MASIPRRISFSGNEKQVLHIALDQVYRCSRSQLWILYNNIEKIKWPKYQENITENQSDLFDDSKYFDLLSAKQIKSFAKETQIKFLLQDWQIQACPNDLVYKLDKQQLLHLTPQQVPYCTLKQLLILQQLKKEKWPAYHEQIPPRKIEFFDDSKYFDLLTEDQFKNIKCSRISYLSKKQLLCVHRLISI